MKLETEKTIAVSINRSIARIQLTRSNVRNCFNANMIKALTQAFEDFASNRTIRAVILCGEGPVFCAGADLTWMQSIVDYSFAQNKADAETLYQLFATLAECPIPVIGQVHGAAYGGALGLLANCDYVIAESQTQFCFSEVKLGISPAVISSFIARKCFLGGVKPYMLSGTVINTEKALRLGIIDEIVEGAEAVASAAQSYAEKFLQCGPEAVRETKKMLQELAHLSWIEQREMTTQIIAERRVSAEGQEGLKAFLEKRKPHWGLS